MRRLGRSPACALLFCLAATPGLAQTPLAAPAAPPAPAAVAPKPPPPAPSAARIGVRTGEHPDFGRMTFQMGNGAEPPAMQRVEGGVELRFHGPTVLDLSALHAIRQVTAVDVRQDGGDTVALLRMPSNGVLGSSGRSGGVFYIDIRDPPKPSAPAPARAAAPSPARTTAQRAAPADKEGLDSLRKNLAARLAIVNGLQPGTSPKPGAPVPALQPVAAPAVPAGPPRPLCKADFTLASWIGADPFTDRLRALRANAARATEGAPEMAALAEFYVGNGLAAEALSSAAAWRSEDPLPADRARLDRVSDIAHLLRHEPIDAASPLLADPADCERADLPLWRAAAAAATGDAAAIHRDAPRARALLRDVPDTLRLQLAKLIADGAPDDTEVLRVMAAVVRNAVAMTPEDETGRLLLQAHIAHAENNASDELLFLQRAAMPAGGLPALQAREQLAALDAGREGPERARGEAVLSDMARTYRYDPMGQDASAVLAEARLRRGDYAGALAAADDSDFTAARSGESRGARLTARILRILLVDPPVANLPPLPDRLTMYWHSEGFATPGERGDDIRLGAARAMLTQNLPEAALDVLQQVSPAALAPPETAAVRALAEARAATGDPQSALAMIAGLPPLPDVKRAGAAALDRLGRPADAAAQLETLDTPADRTLRAELLLRAGDWRAAATAYSALMAEPTVSADIRAAAAERYALATALGTTQGAAAGARPGGMPPRLVELPGATGLTANALAVAAIPSTAAGAPLDAVRDAIARARRIETLLPPPDASAPAAPPNGAPATGAKE